GAGKARDASCGGATRKERDAASALSGQNPEGAARLGELLRDEFGSRRPVLTQIRALHFIPNGTRSHYRLLMKWVLGTASSHSIVEQIRSQQENASIKRA
ncbi:hypothetical protein, partial [Herbaspirillum huttiense]